MLMVCSYPNCPIYRKVLLIDGTIEKRREAMTEDEYFDHLTVFHGYDYNSARALIEREKETNNEMPSL